MYPDVYYCRMVKAELLQDAEDSIIRRLLADPGWVFQEKHNGDHRLIEKQDGKVADYNRNGLPSKGLPASVKIALLQHPLKQFIIDVELVKEQVFVFDFLSFDGHNLMDIEYEQREALYHRAFTGMSPCIVPVVSARTEEEKTALVTRLKKERAEGFVAKELKAHYRPATYNQRWNYRCKFVKECDCVVIGPNAEGHNSVDIGVYGHGQLHRVAGCSLIGKTKVQPGDVITVRYLYATKHRHIVQPRMVRVRTDKRPEECTINQLVQSKDC